MSVEDLSQLCVHSKPELLDNPEQRADISVILQPIDLPNPETSLLFDHESQSLTCNLSSISDKLNCAIEEDTVCFDSASTCRIAREIKARMRSARLLEPNRDDTWAHILFIE